MKLIDKGHPSPNWEHTILKDLSFIKKNLRYPINGKTLAPTIVIGIGLLFLLRTVWLSLLIRNSSFFPYLIAVIVVIGIVASILRYLRVIRFTSITSPYFLSDNIKAIEHFLQSQHLTFAQHPEAPEVFQILSKNLGFRREQREVMVFIADDKRILVNSHFIPQKYTISQPSGHARGMARMLENWLYSTDRNNNHSGLATVAK